MPLRYTHTIGPISQAKTLSSIAITLDQLEGTRRNPVYLIIIHVIFASVLSLNDSVIIKSGVVITIFI